MARLYLLAATVILTMVVAHAIKRIRLALDPKLRKIPGPFWSRLLDWQLKVHVLCGNRTRYIHRLHQSYGSVVRIAPKEVSVSSIEAFHEIHSVGTRFVKGQWYQKQSPMQCSDRTCGVFMVIDPRIANERRKLYLQAAKQEQVRDWKPAVDQLVRLAVSKIRRDASQGTADLCKYLPMMSADILGVIAFGESFNALEKEEKSEVLNYIDMCMKWVLLKIEVPLLWSLLKDRPLPRHGKPMDFFTRSQGYGYRAIENIKRAMQEGRSTLFSKMYPDKGEQPLPDSLIANEASNMIVAGAHTTSATLLCLIDAVCGRPDVLAKLVQEVKALSDELTCEELEESPYLGNVIRETLRLHNPIPASLPRTVPKGGCIIEGYQLPGGSTVCTQAYTFHRDARVFEKPDEFDPDRWLNPTAEMRDCYMPYGGSARSCIGINIANLVLLLTTARLFRECPTAVRVDSTDAKTVDYFLNVIAAGRLEITMC